MNSVLSLGRTYALKERLPSGNDLEGATLDVICELESQLAKKKGKKKTYWVLCQYLVYFFTVILSRKS